MKRSGATIVRIYAMYEPLKVFSYIGAAIFTVGLGHHGAVHLLLLHRHGPRALQSLILAAVLMIVGFQVLLIGLVADMISGNRKLIEDLLYRVRSMELDSRGRRPRARGRAARAAAVAGSRMAEPADTSVVIPAYNEAGAIGAVVGALQRGGPWHEIIVVDDGSADATGARARAAGAIVVRHPYNKGNGAAVKTGIRKATGDVVLIMDGDGQHRPADARASGQRLGEYELVVGARSASTQATIARRFGNDAAQLAGELPHGRDIPDLTSGFRAARRDCLLEFLHLLPNGFSTPTTTTMAFIKAGYSVDFVPIEAEQRVGKSKIRLARDGAKFFLILLKIITIFSPLRIFVPISVMTFALGFL